MASPRKARADRAPCVHAYLAKEWQIEWVVYGYARMHQWKFSIECSHMGRTAILIHGASQISPASPMSISVLGVCEHLPRLHNHGSMWNILTRIRQSWEMPVESRARIELGNIYKILPSEYTLSMISECQNHSIKVTIHTKI